MVDSNVNGIDEVESAVIGHKITGVEGDKITLDDGTVVKLVGYGDCCAFAEVEAFLLHPDKIDHAITGVRVEGNTDGWSSGDELWHIYADMGDVLDITVGYSEGSGYYSFGIDVVVSR